MADVQHFDIPRNNPFYRIQDGSSTPSTTLSLPSHLFDASDQSPLSSSPSPDEKTLVNDSDGDKSDASPTSSNSDMLPDSHLLPLSSPYFRPRLTPKSITPSRFSRFSLSERVFEETEPYLIGAGLYNLGNTCFLNAVLQCITHTVPVINRIRSSTHKSPCDRSNDGFCVLCVLHEHIELALSSSGSVISPEKLVDNMSHISSILQRYHQEDAHEFLQCFLDKLDDCFSVPQSAENDNFVKQIFGGRLISKLRCCNCDRSSECYEPIIDLSLEIKDVDSLASALKSFTTVEKIGEPEAKFTCENCKEIVTAEKQLLLDQVPLVAAFHLKRFTSEGFHENDSFPRDDVHVEKIDKHVEYPLELDLQPFTNRSNGDDVELKYMLYAVVVHSGSSSNSGHYYCYIRSSPDIWYLLDDTEVKRVREEVALSQEAYILFYAKQGTPWFSSLKENGKPSSNTSTTSPDSVLANLENVCELSSGADPIMDVPMLTEYDDSVSGVSMPTTGVVNRKKEDPIIEVEDSVPETKVVPITDASMRNEYEDSKFAVLSPTPTIGEGKRRKEDPMIENPMFGEDEDEDSVRMLSPTRKCGVSPNLSSPRSVFDPPSAKREIPERFMILTPPSSPEHDISPMLLGSLTKGGFETPRVGIKQERVGRSDDGDWKRRAAAKSLRSISSSGRRAKLMAVLIQSGSEGSLKKKSKGIDGASHARRRSCPGH